MRRERRLQDVFEFEGFPSLCVQRGEQKETALPFRFRLYIFRSLTLPPGECQQHCRNKCSPVSEGAIRTLLSDPFSSHNPWRSRLIYLFIHPSFFFCFLGSLTPCLYKFPDHGLSSGSCALSHGFSSLTSAFLSADEAPGGPGIGEVKADIQEKNARDPEDAPAMDSPQIRELEMFANDFKIRRIKLGTRRSS